MVQTNSVLEKPQLLRNYSILKGAILFLKDCGNRHQQIRENSFDLTATFIASHAAILSTLCLPRHSPFLLLENGLPRLHFKLYCLTYGAFCLHLTTRPTYHLATYSINSNNFFNSCITNKLTEPSFIPCFPDTLK